MPYNILTKEEKAIIENKQTERPYSGEYNNFYEEGTFICRKCNAPLFSSQSKFDAQCGWPAFDDTFPNAIKRIQDSDMQEIEIVCNACGAHLGHVFEGEQLTHTNIRHCVNSLSIQFIKKKIPLPRIQK